MLVKPLVRPICRAIAGRPTASLGTGFAPTSLFADGSIGVLYDNNDLSTMFVDAAGTTPATVNGLVGLQLDQSAGLVLGAELVTNGDFSGGTTGWTAANSSIAVVSGSLEMTAVGGAQARANQAVTTVVGKWYEARALIWRGTGATGVDILIPGITSSVIINATVPTEAVVRFLATGTSTNVRVGSSGAALAGETYFADNITVKELPGNHRYQSTTGFKPVLRGTPTGAELFTAYGTPGAGWSVAGATCTATTASSALPTTTAATVGKFYRVTYTVTRSAGSVQLSFGGRTGVSRSAAGQYVEYFDNALNTNALTATGTGFTGTVRIDEVKDVSAGSVTAPYGLQYDGVDDFLQTASVNFTATDKMFVCAGVRKLSDASQALAVELSATVNSNNGAFALLAPNPAGANYQFVARGTSSQPVSATGLAAPITSVVTGVADIPSTSAAAYIRVNGALVQSGIVGGAGTGSFGNYPIYFGRRSGIGVPFNGLDFGFVIVGKTLTSAQISSTERYIAQRTGVSF